MAALSIGGGGLRLFARQRGDLPTGWSPLRPRPSSEDRRGAEAARGRRQIVAASAGRPLDPDCWHAHHGVEIATVRADLIEYRPPGGAFDLVVLAYLQLPEHQIAAVIANAMIAVAPGGTLLVVAHDRANLERGYGGPSRPEVLTTVDLVTAAMGGLEIERAEIAERPVDTPEGERVALDTLVVARRSA